MGFPCSSVGKESACSAGDLGSIPGLGRSPGEGNGKPLQYPCLGNPIDRGVWQATVCGVEKVLDMTQQVNNQPPHQYSLICFISWTAHATVNLFIAVLVGR